MTVETDIPRIKVHQEESFCHVGKVKRECTG